MKRASVVIGANWGDEGKGLMTDYLSSNPSVDPSRRYTAGLVVRFNGGAQAGHTVDDPIVGRHVFHHFGSGTLRGYTTHLSKHFISNPMIAMDERKALMKLGKRPILTADPNGYVTTIYDMMINQMVEESRGVARHGSCGLGIHETIKRNENFSFQTKVTDLLNIPRLVLKLSRIRAEWVPARLAELGVRMTPEWSDRINSDRNLLQYVAICEEYKSWVHLFDDAKAFELDEDYHIVFEGAQGLLLDEDHRFFPHVTHSHTGLTNVIKIAYEAGIRVLDVTYVTRAYATRHGAGPFPGEDPTMRYEDQTNVPNDWQGSLRFGALDIDLLQESIQRDLAIGFGTGITKNANIAVTCMDQVGDRIRVVVDQKEEIVTPDGLISLISKRTGRPVRYLSWGPTRETVQDLSPTAQIRKMSTQLRTVG
jgi:adenylosuccinate synthase